MAHKARSTRRKSKGTKKKSSGGKNAMGLKKGEARSYAKGSKRSTGKVVKLKN